MSDDLDVDALRGRVAVDLAARLIQACRTCVLHPAGPVNAYNAAVTMYLDGDLDNEGWQVLRDNVLRAISERLVTPGLAPAEAAAQRLAFQTAYALFDQPPNLDALRDVGITVERGEDQ